MSITCSELPGKNHNQALFTTFLPLTSLILEKTQGLPTFTIHNGHVSVRYPKNEPSSTKHDFDCCLLLLVYDKAVNKVWLTSTNMIAGSAKHGQIRSVCFQCQLTVMPVFVGKLWNDFVGYSLNKCLYTKLVLFPDPRPASCRLLYHTARDGKLGEGMGMRLSINHRELKYTVVHICSVKFMMNDLHI